MIVNYILNSNYRDYYDFHFRTKSEGNYPVFNRKTTDGLHKINQFEMLKSIGYSVIEYGTAQELSNKYNQIVIYTDPWNHGGEGKQLINSIELEEYQYNLLASRFVLTTENGSISYRELFIGNIKCEMKYINPGNWRTNWPEEYEVQIEILSINRNYNRIEAMEWPIFAVDLVSDGMNKYAIDFNTAPGLKGQEIDRHLDSWEIAKSISEHLDHLRI